MPRVGNGSPRDPATSTSCRSAHGRELLLLEQEGARARGWKPLLQERFYRTWAGGSRWTSFHNVAPTNSGSQTQRNSESNVDIPRALKKPLANGDTRIGRHGAKNLCSLHGH